MGTVERLAPPSGAVLVRVRARRPDWVRGLPAVPGRHVVTASVGSAELRDATSPADLLARGYRIVGVHGPGDGDTANLLVTATLIEGHPAWWQDLVAIADRAFDLRHGPVQQVLGPEIALHLAQ